MTQRDRKEISWVPRNSAIIFADEDVDGLMSGVIVAKQYPDSYQLKFVTARSLTDAMRRFLHKVESSNYDVDLEDLDVYIVDVGINRGSIHEFAEIARRMRALGMRLLYFDSHSNKFNGKTLVPILEDAGVIVHLGQIGTAAASIIQEYLGTPDTERFRKLGALSDREISFNEARDMLHEKEGLRMLQAAVAWGAWKRRSFLHRISRELIANPNLKFTTHKEIIELSRKANKHRDKLYRYVVRHADVLEVSHNPRILAVFCLDRNDFGKARGTIAGHLAGEWGAVIIFITPDEMPNYYSVSVRNHYRIKVDLERLGQLAMAETAGGSKGAYRITIEKDKLMKFLIMVQQWTYSLRPPWIRRREKRQKVLKSQESHYTEVPDPSIRPPLGMIDERRERINQSS